MTPPTPIIIVALNARYSHSSYAALSLRANLGHLADLCEVIETDTNVTPFQLAAWLTERSPQIIGFVTYLWNVELIKQTAQILHQVLPHARIVIGGPEVTTAALPLWRGLAHHLITGEGESAFRHLCDKILRNEYPESPTDTPELIDGGVEDLPNLKLPYHLYNEHDLAHRTIYVESSRGCPFSCAYCTSRRTHMRLFDLPRLTAEFALLLDRGVREFRFLDRSFNADEQHACAVLDIFLSHSLPDLNIHLEIMPRRFGSQLRQTLSAFPPGALHLEVGIQTLNPDVAKAIGRDTDLNTLFDALDFLINQAKATVHADLIFGLPGEDETSFAAGFDRLVHTFDPPELQVNLLKGLPGTPIIQPEYSGGLVFNPNPPYELLFNNVLDFTTITRLQNFARCWELIHNRARFGEQAREVWTTPPGSPFARYMALSQQIFNTEGRMHAIGHKRLQEHLDTFLQQIK
ncbi:MAG: DUF4080 domain-containing protein [Lentisphaerae bacterium]|nr:DUF4080 domain-containing protein [Lentisphaerota bacterium]